ncbi:hypothetical protein LEP1GSC034_1012 [Leptospira interrogans str. 2003000735]|uniref:Uncharacterized protein n=2 Tax=Leptospira interrogans TaxID=173 RepID=A0A829DD35_LEPIR|nr:hypothetical protein [Leptospira interrogans]EMY06276.1 hypothetical protein LEP1GSC029_3149 [Leptospira interrogans str. 2002000626]EMY25617.1 hypothetical protein LEP1GSC115_1482 [Leptospira interrogans serovar Australis str. 200703203]EKN89866.1 hypothetical protein LEP1GSC027_3963 [Leptospira interrogans str. 2002000624]EKQ40278.1 hypothetical protein LEP1GSC025_2158 [Leptospira interrogans str. 2002000621]EKQ46021.1 hypothetical protein LEP1GSC026_3156 [Leptospira interrogans str. 2002
MEAMATKEKEKKQLQYNAHGWATLDNGVRLNRSGQGSVVLFASGAVLFSGGKLSTPTVPKEPTSPELPYVEHDFRMLSKAIIECYALDFTKDSVLKNATSLFATKIYKDHETFVDNSIGAVINPTWSDEKDNEGVNGRFRFFKKFASSIIDRLETDPPILDSCSVGIQFTFIKSHPNLENFYWHLGEEIQGSVVRLIITKIIAVSEVSIVCAGADPNAKKLSLNHFEETSSEPGEEKPQTEENMKLKAKQLLALGLSLESLGLVKQGEDVELSSEQFEVVLQKAGLEITKLKTSLNSYAGLTDQESFPVGFDHESNVAKLKELLDEPKKIIEHDRSEVLKAYRLFVSGKADKTIEEMIESADLKQLKALAHQYGIKLNQKFPARTDELGNNTRASGNGGGELEDTEPYMTVEIPA